jgi:DHA2 family multidrug resistance protein
MCGLSLSLSMLVICRLGQGLCGGPIMPMSQTLLVRVFPPEKRGMAMGLWAMTTTLGPACGPIIGGSISDNMSWHWIFFINVPIAVICTMLGYRFLKAVETETRIVPIDKVGLGLLVFWIACLQVVLDTGRDLDWFASPRIVVLTVMAVIGFCIFVIWELTEEHPVVDLRVFRHRGFSTTCVIMALSFGSYFAGVVAVPQWLQATMGYTATTAGMVTATSAVCAMICSPLAARLLGKVDPRGLICFGTAWMGLMTLARAGWTSGADFFALAWPMGLLGFGIPLMMIPLTTVSLSSVRPDAWRFGGQIAANPRPGQTLRHRHVPSPGAADDIQPGRYRSDHHGAQPRLHDCCGPAVPVRRPGLDDPAGDLGAVARRGWGALSYRC